jgi:G:T-mismatch repair DNA endonuclease (very short patch repair protein)
VSQLEERTISLLKEILGYTTIKREVNVKKLFPEYPGHLEEYDIVIPFYKLIIECHGEQHRSLVSFGKEKTWDTVQKLSGQKRRDKAKQEIADKQGWNYLVIWHDELPNKDDKAKEYLKKRLEEVLLVNNLEN